MTFRSELLESRESKERIGIHQESFGDGKEAVLAMRLDLEHEEHPLAQAAEAVESVLVGIPTMQNKACWQ